MRLVAFVFVLLATTTAHAQEVAPVDSTQALSKKLQETAGPPAQKEVRLSDFVRSLGPQHHFGIAGVGSWSDRVLIEVRNDGHWTLEQVLTASGSDGWYWHLRDGSLWICPASDDGRLVLDDEGLTIEKLEDAHTLEASDRAGRPIWKTTVIREYSGGGFLGWMARTGPNELIVSTGRHTSVVLDLTTGAILARNDDE